MRKVMSCIEPVCLFYFGSYTKEFLFKEERDKPKKPHKHNLKIWKRTKLGQKIKKK